MPDTQQDLGKLLKGAGVSTSGIKASGEVGAGDAIKPQGTPNVVQAQLDAAKPYMEELRGNKAIQEKTKEHFKANAMFEATLEVMRVTPSNSPQFDELNKKLVAADETKGTARAAFEETFKAEFKKAHPEASDQTINSVREGYVRTTKQDNAKAAEKGREKVQVPATNIGQQRSAETSR
jgi:hypothetical protein